MRHLTLGLLPAFLVAIAGCAADSSSTSEVAESIAESSQAQTIPNFDSALLMEHSSWHMNAPSSGGRRFAMGQPGSGTEFLDFHHDFMRRALNWYNEHGGDPSLVK